MSIFRHDTLGSWTRGGQAIVHNVRMTTQVFYQTFLAGLAIWIGGIVWYVSENLGQVEQVEANEGMSYGVNDMRDGVNLSRMQVTRPLVMHTEVTNLPNLMGYLRFGRSLPVVRFEDSYNKVASISEAFEERDTAPIRMAVPTPPVSPTPVAAIAPVKPKGSPTKRRRAVPSDPGAELPLEPAREPPESASTLPSNEAGPLPANSGRDEQAGNPPPPLELFGKPAGFRLSQHGRHDGARNAARPA